MHPLQVINQLDEPITHPCRTFERWHQGERDRLPTSAWLNDLDDIERPMREIPIGGHLLKPPFHVQLSHGVGQRLL
jgi:hypothetical protein